MYWLSAVQELVSHRMLLRCVQGRPSSLRLPPEKQVLYHFQAKSVVGTVTIVCGSPLCTTENIHSMEVSECECFGVHTCLLE